MNDIIKISLEKAFVLFADNEFNSATFSARVTSS